MEEEDEWEKEHREIKETITRLQQSLEDTKVTNTLLEKRLWKVECSSARDRSKIDQLESKLLHLERSVERRDRTHTSLPPAIRTHSSRSLSTTSPFIHPLIFINSLFWILIAPIFYIFPFLSTYQSRYRSASLQQPSPSSPRSPTSPTLLWNRHRSGSGSASGSNSRLETVLEMDELRTQVLDESGALGLFADPIISPNQERHFSLNSEVDDASDDMLVDPGLTESDSTASNLSRISEIAIVTPAKSAYGFVTDIMK